MKALPELFRWLAGFFAVALLALSFVMSAQGLACQDGLSFYTAGDLFNEGDSALYPTMGPASPIDPERFRARYCDRFPPGQKDCEEVAVPFVSPPVALPWVSALARLPFGAAVLGMRLLAALCVIGAALSAAAMAVRQNAALGLPVGVALVLSLPLAMNPVENGQNSPWLAAAAMLALGAARHPGPLLEVAAGGLLGGCAVFKGSPAVLALLWLVPFRPVALGSFGAVLALSGALAAATVPASLWSDYQALGPGFAAWIVDFGQNGSIDAALRALGLLPDGLVPVFPVLKGLVIAGAFLWAWRSGVGPAGRVGLAWAGWLVVTPILWCHYLWVLWALLLAGVGPEATGSRAWGLVSWLLVPVVVLGLTLQGSPAGQVLSAVWVVAGACLLWRTEVRRGGPR